MSRAIAPLRQPTATTCGQACVAMLAGVTVDAARAAIGRRGCTTAADLVRGLRHFGLRCAEMLVPLRKVSGLVPLGIARWARYPVTAGHWTVWTDGYFIDPTDGGCWAPEDLGCILGARGWRLTSILPVEAT